MKRSTAIVIVIVATISFLIYYYKFSNWTFLNRQAGTNNTTQSTEITGILRTTFIENEDKQKLRLAEGMYLLTQINSKDAKKLPNGTTGLYIDQHSMNLNGFVGKCVTIKGSIDSAWINETESIRKQNGSIPKDNLAFVAESVSKKDFKDCNGYDSKIVLKGINTNTTKKIVTGEVQHIERMDLLEGRYDYVIAEIPEDTFGVEVAKETSAADNLEEIPVVATSNEIWQTLENNLKKKIAVEGIEIEDKRKIKTLYITRIME